MNVSTAAFASALSPIRERSGRIIVRMASRVLASRDELVEWAEDDGALDDSIIIAVGESTLTIGLRFDEVVGDDPRDDFRKTSRRYLPHVLTAVDGTVTVEGDLGPDAPFASSLIEEGDVFGLLLETDDASVRAAARGWRVAIGEPVEVAVVPAFDEMRIAFHGLGPLTSTQVVDALARTGISARMFGNWNGSGQSMGAAFVRDVTAPPPVPDDQPLGGAWRVVPGDAEASDPRGAWISGNAAGQSAYAILERTADTDPALVRALVEALASLPGLAWASSGNRLIEDAATRAAWAGADGR